MPWVKTDQGSHRWTPPRFPRAVHWRTTIAIYDRWLRLSSPLQSQTRALSRWVLIAVAIGFIMDSAQIVPVEATLFGLRFESIDQGRV